MAQRIRFRILSTAFEEKLKVLDFVSWLNYDYFVLYGCFSLFLHRFISLMKIILSLNFSRQEAGGEYGGSCGGGSLSWEGSLGSRSASGMGSECWKNRREAGGSGNSGLPEVS